MEKFELESKYLVSQVVRKPERSNEFSGCIKIHPAAWEWLQQMRSRTGQPITQIVDEMIAYCDRNLEIVPCRSSGRSPTAAQVSRQRSTEDLLAEAQALLAEVKSRMDEPGRE